MELVVLDLHHDCRNALNLQKLSQVSSVNENGPSYGLKFISSDIPSQNNWNRLKKYSKIEQDYKNVITNFARF